MRWMDRKRGGRPPVGRPDDDEGSGVLAFVKSGFNLDRMSAKLVGQMTDEEIVAKTGDTAGVRSAPPGLKPLGVFGELLAHSINISLALGKPFGVAVGHYVTGLNNMKDVQPVLGCKKGIAGLKLRANDADRSTGDGPLVEGDGCCLP